MTTNIYILRLEGGRYYIGKTNNLIKRYEEHLNGNGSAWTRKYKPISLEKTISNASPFDEDKYTKEYMSKYGIEKVRGGSYVEVDLDDLQKESLNREIWGAKDCCTNCGKKGHFVKDCYVKKKESTSKSFKSVPTCFRCGRPGHYSSECYASRNIKGYDLDSESEYDSDSDYDYDSDSD